MNHLILISGPTGVGKTQAALDLATRFVGELISADSRQIFKGLNWGTNKFAGDWKKWSFDSRKQRWLYGEIPVHLYDVVEPRERFSVFDFVKLCHQKIGEIWARNKVPIIVGGTGFYQRSLIYPPSTLGIPADWNLRKHLDQLEVELLVLILKSLTLAKLTPIDLNNKRRLIRAIEVASYQGPSQPVKAVNFNYLWLGLMASKEFLFARAIQWVNKISSGLIQEETMQLLKKGYKNTPPLQGIIYKPTIDYLEGLTNFEEYQVRLKSQIKGYIRRQLTWFKKQPEIIWFDVEKPTYFQEVEKTVEKWLNKHKRTEVKNAYEN